VYQKNLELATKATAAIVREVMKAMHVGMSETEGIQFVCKKYGSEFEVTRL
jgi:hypothetical protein